MTVFKPTIPANRPKITDQLGPLVADAQHLDGLVLVHLPNTEEFLASPSPAADRELAWALETLAAKYPDRKLSLFAWEPNGHYWPEAVAVLSKRDCGIVVILNPGRVLRAWRQSTERN